MQRAVEWRMVPAWAVWRLPGQLPNPRNCEARLLMLDLSASGKAYDISTYMIYMYRVLD